MYFLPFQSRTRFAAFKDTPAVEAELNNWLVEGRTWDDLPSNTLLMNNIVKGNPILGIFFQRNNTFITNNVGSPQISFEGNPKTLLFIMSDYKVASSSGSLYYENIQEDYIRREISPHVYEPTTENLEDVWDELNRLDLNKTSITTTTLFEQLIQNTRSEIEKLSKRNDPLEVIMPAIAAEAGERRTVINDILQQIDILQAPSGTAVNVTNYPTKTEFYDQISRRATQGYVQGLLATKASKTELDNHIFDQSLHNLTYLDVGSPSLEQYQTLVTRVTALETALTAIQLLNPVRSIQGTGGLLATNQGSGVWRVDSSYIGMGSREPQETSFYFGGPLQQSTNNGGGWIAWEDANIIGIRATLDIAPQGAPVVLDIKREGESLYTNPSDRPTFLSGQDEIIATLPDNVLVEENDEITVDIVNVGQTVTGSGLNIQMRYQYVN